MVQKNQENRAVTNILVGKQGDAIRRCAAVLGASMVQQQPIRSGTGQREIPDKLYFRIGEVARLCEVPAYVLRFWESEFTQLKPNKGGTGQRLYRRRDVEMALRVKTLLYDEGYTIPGARQLLKTESRSKGPSLLPGIEEPQDLQKLRRLRKDLQDLLAMLAKPAGTKQPAAVHSIRAPKVRKLISDAAEETLFATPVSDVDAQSED